jgi:hypothetical protein
MRTLFAAAALSALTLPAWAQLEKGTTLLGGTLAAQSERQRGTPTTGGFENQSITPQVYAGRFLRDRLAVGVQFEQMFRNSPAQFPDLPRGGIFVRNYWSVSPQFATFLHTDLTVGRSSYTTSSSDQATSLGLGTQLGFAYFSRRAFSIEAKANFLRLGLLYDFGRGEDPASIIRSDIQAATLGPTLELTLAWYIGTRTLPATETGVDRPRITRGTRAWGGSFSSSSFTFRPSSMSANPSTVASTEVGPDFAAFIRDDLAMGLRVGGGFQVISSQGQRDAVYWNASLTPYVRPYRMLNKSLGLFLEGFGMARFVYMKGNDYRDWTGQLGLRPGIHYFLGKRWALEGTAGFVGFAYNSTELGLVAPNSPFASRRTWSFSNQLGLDNLGVGLRYFVR